RRLTVFQSCRAQWVSMSPAPLVRSRQAPRAGAVSGEPSVGGSAPAMGSRVGRIAALGAGLGNGRVAEPGALPAAAARPVEQRQAVRRALVADRSAALGGRDNTGRNWI